MHPSRPPDGYSQRPGTIDDVEAVVALLNAHSQHLNGRQEHNAGDVRSELTLPGFDIASSTCLVLGASGELAGYLEIWDDQSPPVHPRIWGRVHPDHFGRGIGRFLLDWAHKRAQQAIDRCPPGVRVAYWAFAQCGDQRNERLFAARGLKVVRYNSDMLVDLSASLDEEPAPPDGIVIRPYRHPDELEAMVKANDLAFKDHWGYVPEPFEDVLREWRHWFETDSELDPALCRVAIDVTSGTIAGCAICRRSSYHDPDVGWVDQLSVGRAWRRRGIARALLRSVFRAFRGSGIVRVGLDVDSDSITGAVRLYEQVGMRVTRSTARYEQEIRAGRELSTVAVGAD